MRTAAEALAPVAFQGPGPARGAPLGQAFLGRASEAGKREPPAASAAQHRDEAPPRAGA